jgi:hypothetical protein
VEREFFSQFMLLFIFPFFWGGVGFFRAAFDRYGVFGLFSEVVEAAARNP